MLKGANGRGGDENRTGVRRLGRTIYFFDCVNDETVCDAIYLVHQLETESLKKPIQIVINSGGGGCYDGLALYDKLRSSECQISTIASGIVASMAVIIFLAGDSRVITENARLMNHQISTYLEGRITDAEIDIKETRVLEEIMLDIISDRTGRTVKVLKAERKNGDRYISADDSIIEGYSHEMIINKRTRRRRRKKK